MIEDWEVWGDPREVERRKADRKRAAQPLPLRQAQVYPCCCCCCSALRITWVYTSCCCTTCDTALFNASVSVAAPCVAQHCSSCCCTTSGKAMLRCRSPAVAMIWLSSAHALPVLGLRSASTLPLSYGLGSCSQGLCSRPALPVQSRAVLMSWGPYALQMPPCFKEMAPLIK